MVKKKSLRLLWNPKVGCIVNKSHQSSDPKPKYFRSITDSRYNVVHTKTYGHHYKGHEIPKVKSFGTLNRTRRLRIHRSELLNIQQADTCPFVASHSFLNLCVQQCRRINESGITTAKNTTL
jgi:hypothetical protein